MPKHQLSFDDTAKMRALLRPRCCKPCFRFGRRVAPLRLIYPIWAGYHLLT